MNTAISLTLISIGATAVLALWKIPKWQVQQFVGLTAEKHFEYENEARKTLAQILGGIIVLGGLYSSIQTLSLSREGEITDRFTRAIDQLGALDASRRLIAIRC